MGDRARFNWELIWSEISRLFPSKFGLRNTQIDLVLCRIWGERSWRNQGCKTIRSWNWVSKTKGKPGRQKWGGREMRENHGTHSETESQGLGWEVPHRKVNTVDPRLPAAYPIGIWPLFFANKNRFGFEWQSEQPEKGLPLPPLQKGDPWHGSDRGRVREYVPGKISTRKHMERALPCCVLLFLPSGTETWWLDQVWEWSRGKGILGFLVNSQIITIHCLCLDKSQLLRFSVKCGQTKPITNLFFLGLFEWTVSFNPMRKTKNLLNH